MSAKDLDSVDFFNESNRKTDYYMDNSNEKSNRFDRNWWTNLSKKTSHKDDQNDNYPHDLKGGIGSSLSVDKLFKDRWPDNKQFERNNDYVSDNKVD